MAARTDLVCSAPGKTIASFSEGLGLRELEPPFEAPSFELHLAWHARSDQDRGNEWLRETILALFEGEREA